MKLINIVGKRYGRLVVIEKADSLNGHTRWLCKCDCGKECIVHGVITVTQALSNGTILYDLPNYSYGMPNASNNPVIAADNASYTTVGVDNTAKTIKVTYNGGMQTGRFEIFLMGWIN